MTTARITLPNATHERLQRLAAEDGLMPAQEIDKLIGRYGRRPKPSIGGFRSGRSWTAEDLARGFGS
jgi:hypothetical protein